MQGGLETQLVSQDAEPSSQREKVGRVQADGAMAEPGLCFHQNTMETPQQADWESEALPSSRDNPHILWIVS